MQETKFKDLGTTATLASDNKFLVLTDDTTNLTKNITFSDLKTNLSIPSAVTELTVSGWGFTKNTGTVTSVNNVSPVNGNVSITIPTVPTIATSVNASSTNAETVGAKLFYDTCGDIETLINAL